MTKRRSGLHLVVVLLAATALTSAHALNIGETAPKRDVAMKGADGKSYTLGQVAGSKGTLVVFTCNHCPFAKAWEERIVAIGNSYPAKGVSVIAINSNDPAVAADDGYEGMQARAKERGMTFPYVMDETSGVARAFGASKTPEVFLFDAAGKLIYHGAIDDNSKEPEKVEQRYLHDALEATVAGRAVPVAETKALGCGIKFRTEG